MSAAYHDPITVATVLTMDDAHSVLTGGDVLVVGDRIAEVGHGLTAPDGALVVCTFLFAGTIPADRDIAVTG